MRRSPPSCARGFGAQAVPALDVDAGARHRGPIQAWPGATAGCRRWSPAGDTDPNRHPGCSDRQLHDQRRLYGDARTAIPAASPGWPSRAAGWSDQPAPDRRPASHRTAARSGLPPRPKADSTPINTPNAIRSRRAATRSLQLRDEASGTYEDYKLFTSMLIRNPIETCALVAA